MDDLKIQHPTNYGLYEHQFGYAISKNRKYLIVFSHNLWIIDLKTLKIKKRHITPPVEGDGLHFHAVMIDDEKDEMLQRDIFVIVLNNLR